MKFLKQYLLMSLIVTASSSSFAAYGGGGGGNWSMGGNFGIASVSQDDMDNLNSRANSTHVLSTAALGSAWELAGYIQYRFSGSIISLQFRPSYFFHSEDGKSAAGNDYNYGVSGFSLFPIFRFNWLENSVIKFYTQLGIGWAQLTAEVTETNAALEAVSAKLSGSNFGFLGGIGAEFCFISASHCFLVEGNLRYLPVERMLYDSVSGNPDHLKSDGGTQPVKGGEAEIDGRNFTTTMSGIMGVFGYVYNF